MKLVVNMTSVCDSRRNCTEMLTPRGMHTQDRARDQLNKKVEEGSGWEGNWKSSIHGTYFSCKTKQVSSYLFKR